MHYSTATYAERGDGGLVHILRILVEITSDMGAEAELAARRHGRLRGRVRRQQRSASNALDRLLGARQRLEELTPWSPAPR